MVEISSANLKKGDLIIVKAGEQIPADGEVVEGGASVDESAITGESAPVIRESGGDRSAVTGGTTVTSDWLVIEVTSEAGESFLDKMIAMVEGASRKKTPNEIALQILLVALTVIFLLVTIALYSYSLFSANQAGISNPTSVTALVALLVCLAPTTIGALLSAIGIAGMSRLNEANVLAMSGRAIEAAGDVDILMLDKTGTITLGNREACEFIPVDGVPVEELADAAQLASLADETPEGRSIVVLAKEKFDIRGRNMTKPFSIDELLARIRVAFRKMNYDNSSAKEEPIFINGGLKIDYSANTVYVDEEEVHLTPMEYRLLCLLAKNVGKVLTHNYILDKIWVNVLVDRDTQSLRVFMATLRKKIEKDPSEPKYIQTHIGVGYRLIRIADSGENE